MNDECLSIGSVERDTGIARDTLRIWERRYGFPEPVRNDKGERMYPEGQLRRLQRIRRLLDQGLRPGKVVALSDADLEMLEADHCPETPSNDLIEQILNILQDTDASGLEALLSATYQQQGMQSFIIDTVVPLLQAVGQRWAAGKLQIFEEHLLSEVLTRLINSEISMKQKTAKRPRVLLATLPGEEHTMGLLMVSAMLSARDISVINLGAEVPLDQLVSAVARFDADVLGVTFSGAYQYENIRGNLHELRDAVAADVAIWTGGEGVKRLRKLPEGVTKFTSLDKLPVDGLPADAVRE
jgi:methanogenic corrinoid protein MtbC1